MFILGFINVVFSMLLFARYSVWSQRNYDHYCQRMSYNISDGGFTS